MNADPRRTDNPARHRTPTCAGNRVGPLSLPPRPLSQSHGRDRSSALQWCPCARQGIRRRRELVDLDPVDRVIAQTDEARVSGAEPVERIETPAPANSARAASTVFELPRQNGLRRFDQKCVKRIGSAPLPRIETVGPQIPQGRKGRRSRNRPPIHVRHDPRPARRSDLLSDEQRGAAKPRLNRPRSCSPVRFSPIRSGPPARVSVAPASTAERRAPPRQPHLPSREKRR